MRTIKGKNVTPKMQLDLVKAMLEHEMLFSIGSINEDKNSILMRFNNERGWLKIEDELIVIFFKDRMSVSYNQWDYNKTTCLKNLEVKENIKGEIIEHLEKLNEKLYDNEIFYMEGDK